jgi:hypothetical protein
MENYYRGSKTGHLSLASPTPDAGAKIDHNPLAGLTDNL